jgi:hypothetical protein
MGEIMGHGDRALLWAWLLEAKRRVDHFKRHLLLLEARQRALRDEQQSEPGSDDPPTLLDP